METVALPNGYENNINSGDNEYNTNQLNKDIGSNNGINASNLSKENNFPELAYKTVVEELIANNYDDNSLTLSVASRDVPGGIVNV